MAQVSNSTRVLVVDDEPLVADTLGIILQRTGFEVLVTYDGLEAVAAAKSFRPDIVLADYSMPKMNGIDACIEIKGVLPACRIIMLSGQSLSEEIEPYRSRGYDFAILSKPMHPSDLLKAIEAERVEPNDCRERLRVLNVDDVEEHRYSLSRLFAHAGFEVSEAATGTDALRIAIESKPDLILLDIHLPDGNGYEVCAALRKNPETARITVVHVTNSDFGPDSALRSANAGADAYIPFPFPPKKLVERSRELLQLRYLNEQAS